MRLNYPKSYNDCVYVLNGRVSRKIGNNTYLRRSEDTVAVRYHSTDIVTFDQFGSIRLDTGSWHTRSTYARMWWCGIWIHRSGGVTSVKFNDREYIYSDGMILMGNGRVRNAMKGDPEVERAAIRRQKRLDNKPVIKQLGLF